MDPGHPGRDRPRARAGAAARRDLRTATGPRGGVPRLRDAVGLYYRSQFFNTVLPGGVVGDVQRAVTQGRDAGNVAQGARAVVIERTMGQVVQIALAVIVLAGFGLEFEGYLLPALGTVVAVLVLAVFATAVASTRARRALRRELGELSAGVGAPGPFVRVVIASRTRTSAKTGRRVLNTKPSIPFGSPLVKASLITRPSSDSCGVALSIGVAHRNRSARGRRAARGQDDLVALD